MARPDTWSDQQRPGKLKHHSARGSLPRNAGDFTRGSQLITHEYLMWFASAKLPFLVWFFTFLFVLSIALALRLHEHEVQMIGMRIYAAGWGFMEFSPGKIINLTLPSGEVIPAPISMVPSHPDVVIAWSRLMRAVWGSLFISLFIAVPLTVWFVDFSKRRGKSILEERHQRGAMLVDAHRLAAVINEHNKAALTQEIAERLPQKTFDEVMAMSFEDRKAAGIHHAYSIAGIPFPWRTEQTHTMMIGSTGTGKTTQMRALIAQMRARRDRAVVFDLTGAYVEAFYNPETDIILNPMDERCPSWTPFNEAKNHADFINIAAALMAHDGGTSEPFWILSARTLFVESCNALVKAKTPTNQALASRLMMAALEDVHELVQNTIAEPMTTAKAAKMGESVRAVLNTNAQALLFLPEHNPSFSICDWVRSEDKPGSILFITSSHSELALNRALLSLWTNLAVHTLMRLPRTRSLRTWFFFDEVHALHRLPGLEDGMQTARGFGGAFVLGIHSFAKLSETYGKEGAQNLASLARTKLILSAADRDTAEHCSDFIGQREVRRMDEAYSYGYSNIRDAATITPRSDIEPLVIPDDIMKLPSLRGFLVYPEGFDAAHIKLAYKDYPAVAPSYVPRENVEPLEFLPPPSKTENPDDVDGGDEAEGRARKSELELEAETPEEADAKARRTRGKTAAKVQPAAAKTPPETPLKPGGMASGMAFKPPGSDAKPPVQARDSGALSKATRVGPANGTGPRAGKAARELGEGLAPEQADERSPGARSGPQQAGPEFDNEPEL